MDIIKDIPVWPFTILAALIGIFGAIYVRYKTSLSQASAAFRIAIDPNVFGELKGHALVLALIGAQPGTGPRIEGIYAKHKRAVDEFRYYLGPIGRHRLNRAWKTYHGGNEDCPNFFVLYGIPENGNEILKHNLESLRNVANQT